MKTGNSHKSPERIAVEIRLQRLQDRLRQANHRAAKGIQENIRKFSALTDEAERDLKKLRGVGKTALRAFRTELKRSWKDLKRVAQEQF